MPSGSARRKRAAGWLLPWHCLNHGLHHRGARPVIADERDHSGAACRAVPLGGSERQGGCCHGTASTMACITEAMGLSLPMSATIPAPHAERFRSAEASGKVAAAMAKAKGPKPSEFLTASSFRNAQVVLQAIGGSTNGLIHLTAIQHRTKHKVDLDAFDKLGREVPVLVDLKPS